MLIETRELNTESITGVLKEIVLLPITYVQELRNRGRRKLDVAFISTIVVGEIVNVGIFLNSPEDLIRKALGIVVMPVFFWGVWGMIELARSDDKVRGRLKWQEFIEQSRLNGLVES